MESDEFYDLTPVRCYCGEVLGNKSEIFLALIRGQVPAIPVRIPVPELEALLTRTIGILNATNPNALDPKVVVPISLRTEIRELEKRLRDAGVNEFFGVERLRLSDLIRLKRDLEIKNVLDIQGRMTPEQAFDYLGLRSPCCRAHLANPARLAYGGDVEIPELETKKTTRNVSRISTASTSNPTVVLNIPVRKTLIRTSRVPARITRQQTETRRKEALDRGEQFNETEFLDI